MEQEFMSTDERYAHYHRQLDALERRLKETTSRMGESGPQAEQHQRERTALRDKAAGFRTRLESSELSTWATIKHQLATEWQGLTQAFERWTTRVDEHFK
jgi:chromosome segregation ATPase